MNILVVNSGSSSYKLSLFHLADEHHCDPLWEGFFNFESREGPLLMKIENHKGSKIEQNLSNLDKEEVFKILIESLWNGPCKVIEDHISIDRIGHRVVHGGGELIRPVLIDDAVIRKIVALVPLAPLHNSGNLKGIEWMKDYFPSIPQYAVFDTAFHTTMPNKIKTYPVPWEWKEQGIIRYGFHGISHHYCAERIPQLLKRDPLDLKIINCHLGNGCSLCAIKEGQSYETTMGFTPLEGLMMGSRSGSIDPGILLYLIRERKMPSQDLDDLLNFSSGLKGIGGHSDMRKLLALQNDERARLAVEMFVHRLKTSIGAMAASLEGFHVLSFTAGMGENAPAIREAVCKGLSFLNVRLDLKKNSSCRPDADISDPLSSIRVVVVHTREEWMIARACFQFP